MPTRLVETRTKIVATLGPSSWDLPVLSELLAAGVDVCRINCSHTDHHGIRTQVARVREAAAGLGKPIAVLLDLQGPKIRTGAVEEPRRLEAGDLLTVVMSPGDPGVPERIGTTYPRLAHDVSPGATVIFADGALCGQVEAVRLSTDPPQVDVRIREGGVLGAHKGINLPNVEVSAPSLTDKDLADLEVGLEVGVDLVALSFVRRVDDVLHLRREMERRGARIPVIAKIEKPEAVREIDEIVRAAEGVMVARGDLGVEAPLERVPVLQKRIIEAASRGGVLCITATQMLDSMERNPRPTRAETTDVANAILDGTDAIMLSGETAIGRYPLLAVQTMDRIAREVECSQFFGPTPPHRMPSWAGPRGTVARAACYAVIEEPRPLVVFTWSGGSAVFVSKARPPGPIYALTADPQVVNRLAAVWGVTPILVPPVATVDDVIAAGERVLLRDHHVVPGQETVFMAGRSPLRGVTNLLRIHAAGADASR